MSWRNRTKLRIIEAMGGSCCLCGYDRSPRALDLHHLDPVQKDFSLGSVRANPRSWGRIVEELRKCVLVCNRCHAEIHDGMASVPADASGFDEAYSVYRGSSPDHDQCPVCSGLKPVTARTCSLKCAASRRGKVNWDKVDLEGMLASMPMTAIADKLGVSEAAVRKRRAKVWKAASDTPARRHHCVGVHLGAQPSP